MDYRKTIWIGSLGLGLLAPAVRADSIWQRRDPNMAYLFYDTRARRIGDVLTIVVRESTEFEGMDKRELEKDTKTSSDFSLKGAFSQGKSLSHSFSGSLNGLADSQRQLNGKANNMIDRKFTDQMSVVVVAVQPNGNLVVEGFRTHVVAKEERTLRVRGIIRPQDVSATNTIQSQFIANLEVRYEGRGQESSYLDNGWLGKIMNVLWPF